MLILGIAENGVLDCAFMPASHPPICFSVGFVGLWEFSEKNQ